jgi:hypothetical protein
VWAANPWDDGWSSGWHGDWWPSYAGWGKGMMYKGGKGKGKGKSWFMAGVHCTA